MSLRLEGERGSVALGVALIGFVLLFALAIGLVGATAVSYATAATAADAAALGAAPVTFRPFGASGNASTEAARIAHVNGARLVSCVCMPDPSWRERTVTVAVARSVQLPILGEVTVRATSRATFDPERLLIGGFAPD